MKRLICNLLLLSLCGCVWPIAKSELQEAKVVSYSTKRTVSMNEPVVVEVTIHNTFQRELSVDLGRNDKGAFRISITDPSGHTDFLPPLVEISEGISIPGLITLEPDMVYVGRLVLNEWYGFPKVGRYVIDLEMMGSVQTEGDGVTNASHPFRITVTVIARDPKRLREVAEQLTERVFRASSNQEYADYALALSYMNDPVAVPHLARLLETGRVDQVAVEGLRRIGNDEAAQVLIATLESKDEETVMFAQIALRRLASETDDLLVKRQIEKAIK